LVGLLLLAALVVWVCLGGGFTRPAPSSQVEYIARYMKHFDEREIERVDYVFKGGFRGAFTVARVQFKGPVKILGAVEAGTYDPDAFAKDPGAGARFEDQRTLASDGKTPPWFDFPFGQRMRMCSEGREWDSPEVRKGAQPPYRYKWYVDDKRNVVYFWGTSK
jgi:hypothetical protein